ncbi:hypothetical protein ACFLV7_09500 [Chloroflexota bacterium]
MSFPKSRRIPAPRVVSIPQGWAELHAIVFIGTSQRFLVFPKTLIRIELRAVHWQKLRYQIVFKESKGGLGCTAVMDRTIIQNDHQVRLASHNIALSYMF